MGAEKIENPLFVGRDILVTCRNSSGDSVRAVPVRMERWTVLMEIYNPYSILQLSEVLSDFEITVGDRKVYRGRAVVARLINTGIMQLCEVGLEEGWLDVDLFSPISHPERLREEFEGFLQNWRRLQSFSPEFKVAVADFETLLTELRRWLDQVELGVHSEGRGSTEEMEHKVLMALEPRIVDEANEWFGRFDDVADRVAEDLRPAHRAYARRKMHPLVMCSPFVYRTYTKPLGYAGDYEMVNMILGEPHKGGTLFAKLVNSLFLQNPPAQAHRNRIGHLKGRLVEETKRIAAQGRRARIFNLGCGPAREVQLFLEQEELSNHVDIVLADFNTQTLDYTRKVLEELRQRNHRTTGIEFVERSVHQMLKDTLRGGGDGVGTKYDFVYCAGLFDYVSDRVCRRLTHLFHDMAEPEGLVLVTNVNASRPFRHSMEYLLEWHLIFRDGAQMRALIPEDAIGACDVLADPLHVNVYLEMRKPAAPL